MGWAADINKGLNEKRFKLYTQPIVPLTNLDDRKHCEVLIRYQDEDDTIIRPGEFLGPAERFNLVEKIDRWVISEVMRWLSEHKSSKGDVLFSINLSGRSLGSPSFHNYVEQLLLTENIDASCLCFEITETAAIKDVDKSVKFIEMVKSHGGKFSLDDFGSGLSSFNYLKQFPVDYLKIDGAFIKDILVDAQSYAFVRSITEVGHCLGMKVIAEYVNSRMMLHMLREARVDYLQGYSIGMPEPIENLDKDPA
jgi:Amt family ammonium transporter